MPEGKSIRSFVAVDIAAPVRAGLRALQAELAQADADVRWVRAEGIHVTLKFLGAVEAARLERVHTALVDALHAQPALHLQVRGLGAFPSLRRPRVLWTGLHGDGLDAVARYVETALTALGFTPERRAFTPHVTIGRVNSLRGWPRLEEQFKAHLDDNFGGSAVEAVIIYRSTLRPDGAVYTPLWTIPLTRNKEGGTP
jgi:RNA 2',3'-cyclic 3'-phosphodiesterase